MTSHGNAFDFQLVSPERILFQGQATMVVLPATSGLIGILAGHAPTIITLTKGIIDVYTNGHVAHRLFVGGGFANITETSCLTMADDAISVEDLMEADIEQYIKEVETAIENSIIEEEKEALRRTAAIERSKLDTIERLQPAKKQI